VIGHFWQHLSGEAEASGGLIDLLINSSWDPQQLNSGVVDLRSCVDKPTCYVSVQCRLVQVFRPSDAELSASTGDHLAQRIVVNRHDSLEGSRMHHVELWSARQPL
jgi:hypothetical protein